MGCFDSVMVPCPQCGEKTEFQSKGGECLLRVYELHEAPADVLSDVNRHAPNICPKCGTEYAYAIKMNVAGGFLFHPRSLPVKLLCFL